MKHSDKYEEIYRAVRSYYEEKFKTYGNTAKGVDWPSEESQELRFEQLCQILPENKDEEFSLLDYGSGYGALYPFVKKQWKNCLFTGYDISSELINSARENFPEAEWITEMDENTKYDYIISSGIFNVRGETPWLLWEAYVKAELEYINELSRKGFSFNMLTAYSDPLKVRNYLYYGSPAFYFDYCKTRFSKWVALKHDYPLYEFSILIRKEV